MVFKQAFSQTVYCHLRENSISAVAGGAQALTFQNVSPETFQEVLLSRSVCQQCAQMALFQDGRGF